MTTPKPRIRVDAIKTLRAYDAIKTFYGDRRAERSQVPLIQHIDEGLLVMARADAHMADMRAYCLHPLFQNDAELSTEGLALLREGIGIDSYCGALVMEYRNQANRWLSDKVRLEERENEATRLYPECVADPVVVPVFDGMPTPGPLLGVRMMLIGDKVQNRKDFLRYHQATHPRSRELTAYFEAWMQALGVSDDEYQRLTEGL